MKRDPELEAAVQDLKDRHFLISIQTGPWRGKGDWSYKVHCIQCGWEDLADNYEEACDLRNDHKTEFNFADDDEWDVVV